MQETQSGKPRRGNVGWWVLVFALWWGPTLWVSADEAPTERWVVLEPVTRGVSVDEAATFRDLLQAALSTRPHTRFVTPPQETCGDEACARRLGDQVGADVAVHSVLGRLGERISVLVVATNVSSGDPLWQDRMAVAESGELDVAAERLARALLSGRSVERGRELGSISEDEARTPTRMQGTSGLTAGLLFAAPIGGSAGGGPPGFGGSFGYWFEGSSFAIEPRLTLRAAGSESGESNEWTHWGLDLGVYWLPLQGFVSPFVGGGIGLHYLSARRLERTGVAIPTETLGREEGWAPGLFVRGGVYLFRTWRVRVSFVADFDITWKSVGSRRAHQIFSTGPVVHF